MCLCLSEQTPLGTWLIWSHNVPSVSRRMAMMTDLLGTGRGTRIRQACDACKLRKTKCSGQGICTTCIQSNYTCVYSNNTAALLKRSATDLGVKPDEILSLFSDSN